MNWLEINTLLEEFNRNTGALDQAILDAAKALGAELPTDYTAFLRQSNGGEGMIGEHYVILWRAEELSEMNEAYQTDEYAPGLILIGSDGGGEAFAFDKRVFPWPVVSVPFVGMELRYANIMASSFEAFLKSLLV